MRVRALCMAAAVAAFTMVAPVDAAKAPRREMLPYHYSDQNHHVGGPGFGAGAWNTDDAYVFHLKKGETAISAMVLDDGERPVSAAIVQIRWDSDYGNAKVGHAETWVEFCEKTDGPVPVSPDLQIEIFVQKGTCEDGTPSLPTEGDIVVDFHRS